MRRWVWVCLGFALFFTAFFGPVVFTGKLMASGDGVIESLPAYFGPHHLWEPLILLGYPMYADPNQVYWYPLAWLRFIPGTYNLFALLPFWLAAIGTYGLVRALTRSTAAGLVAGVAFALGGFMISHAGHLMIVHPAAWSPFALWSLEELRQAPRRRWFVVLALSVALCALGGQPQVLAFTLALGAFYAIVSSGAAPCGRRRYLGQAGLATLLGLGVAAPGLLPQALLASESLRQTLSFDRFVELSASPASLVLGLVFPYHPQLAFAFTEATNFAGLGVLSLAAIAVLSPGPDRRIWFWAAVALAALALSTGDAFGLASLTYHLPLYDRFRLPGRHAFEWTLATAVLAGYGTAALQRGAGVARCAIAVAATGALAGAAFLIAGSSVPANPLADATFASAIYACAATGLALLAWSMRPKSVVLVAIALATVAGELAYFGEQAYWRPLAAGAATLNAPAVAGNLAGALRASGRRAFWAPGIGDAGMAPNLSLLWGVPVVSGYTPLEIAPVVHLLGLTDTTTVSTGPSLDVAGTRFIVAPAQEQSAKPASAPFDWRDLGAVVSAPDETHEGSVTLGTQRPVRADRIAMVSALGDAVAIPDRAKVARVFVTDVRGRVTAYDLLAGRDTSEIAYDRPDVRPQVRHRRASVFTSLGGYGSYVTSFASGATQPIDHVTIAWTYRGRGALTVMRVSLIDTPAASAYPVGSLGRFYGERSRFRDRGTVGGFAVLENARAFPRAWTVRDLRDGSGDDAFYAIHSGVARDGRPFDARATAFVERTVAHAGLVDGAVSVTAFDDGRLALTSDCSGPCFVVSSDAWYPFWQASIDGTAAPLVRTDGALRGLLVPGGHHVVEERFVPYDLLLGALASALALAAIAAKIARLW